METTYNVASNDFLQQAQALICLKAFDNICAKSQGKFRIVPLKGIDLMHSLYADTLDRELKDIDLLVIPAERAMRLVEILQNDGYRTATGRSFPMPSTRLPWRRKRRYRCSPLLSDCPMSTYTLHS